MIRLNLKGTFPRGFPLLGSAKSEFKKLSKHLAARFEGMVINLDTDEEEGGTVYTIAKMIHPIARPIRVRVARPDQITVEAETGGVGPGYHQFLCEAFSEVGVKMGITWEMEPASDPTGYFLKQDRWNLEGAFLSQLSDAVCDLVDAHARGETDLALMMPTPDLFQHKGIIATPMGPRHLEWMEKAAHDPRSGIDVYAWWDAGCKAPYHHGRAWSILWNHARLRKPLTSFEDRLWNEMLDCFEKAYREDVRLKYPWTEWLRFIGLSSRQTSEQILTSVGQRAAREKDEYDPDPRMFRKGEYRAVFPTGWMITLPAILAEQFDPATRIWQAWDGTRTIQINEIPVKDVDDPNMAPEKIINEYPPLNPDGDTDDMKWTKKGAHSRGNLHRAKAGGRTFWRLSSITAIRGSILNCAINFDNDTDRDWALNVWRSIEYQKRK